MNVISKADSHFGLSINYSSPILDINRTAMNSVTELQMSDDSINKLGMKILYNAWFQEVFSSDGTNEDSKQEW